MSCPLAHSGILGSKGLFRRRKATECRHLGICSLLRSALGKTNRRAAQNFCARLLLKRDLSEGKKLFEP